MRPFPVHCPSYLAVCALITGMVAARSALAEKFPYQARISVPGAPIRSGPGESFYVTETLPEGDTVEIYRRRSDGWCAIRPTQDSFSWVFSSHVKLLENSLAEVDKEDVPSRIGSRISNRRNAVQVRLKKGEVVQIVGEAGEEGQKWYKIAPPAGEFRWIHASAIGRAGGAPLPAAPVVNTPARMTPRPIQIRPPSIPSTAPAVVTISATDNSAAPAPATLPTSPASPATSNQWRAAPIAPPLATIPSQSPAVVAPSTTPTPPTAPPSATTAAAPTTEAPSTPTSATSTTAASTIPPQPQPLGPVSDDLARQLTDVELRLSRMIAEPPHAWQVAPLQKEAEQLLTQALTVSERDAVKRTLDKVDRFAAIERRYQQVAATAQPSQQPNAASSNVAANAAADGGRYDAVGVLRPVVSKRPGAPQFALVDQRGQVVSFVTATPDVNLQPYVGQRVGVIGNQGFIPEFHRAHVTAGRVTPLDQRIVR